MVAIWLSVFVLFCIVAVVVVVDRYPLFASHDGGSFSNFILLLQQDEQVKYISTMADLQ